MGLIFTRERKMKKFNLTKDNSEDIGFVTDCLLMGVISLKELKEWICKIIHQCDVDSLPTYIYNLLDYNGENSGVYNVISFSPNSKLRKIDEYALYGIGIKRFGTIFDMPIPRDVALNALDKNPYILERFKKEFDFINLDFG